MIIGPGAVVAGGAGVGRGGWSVLEGSEGVESSFIVWTHLVWKELSVGCHMF